MHTTNTNTQGPRRHSPDRGLALVLATTGLALLSACASVPAPNEQLAVARASVERATGAAAAEAPMEISAARDKLNRANAAFAQKDYATARRLAEEADADAALAEARSRSTRSGRALNEVRDGIRMLREEMTRQPVAP
jgi:hypothetical protein